MYMLIMISLVVVFGSWNSSVEWLDSCSSVLRGRWFKSLIVWGEKQLCVICVIHEGIGNESVCMLHESQRGGMSLSVCGMATFWLTIYWNWLFKHHRDKTVEYIKINIDTHVALDYRISPIDFKVKGQGLGQMWGVRDATHCIVFVIQSCITCSNTATS